jgi:hypothetical protein
MKEQTNIFEEGTILLEKTTGAEFVFMQQINNRGRLARINTTRRRLVTEEDLRKDYIILDPTVESRNPKNEVFPH